MRTRRLRKQSEALEISAFINLIVVLVPFLLSTAVFSQVSVVDLTLPGKTNGVEQLKVNDLKLEVVVRHDAIEVGDKIGGLIQRIPNTADGVDATALNTLMFQIKRKFPDTSAASVLPTAAACGAAAPPAASIIATASLTTCSSASLTTTDAPAAASAVA